jgi:hypothetical protein
VDHLFIGWAPSVLRDCPFSAIYWLVFESLRPVYANLLHRPVVTVPDTTNIVEAWQLSAQRVVQDAHKDENVQKSDELVPLNPSYPAFITFLSGATAGMVAAICTHPFDVLKTRQQVAAWTASSNHSPSANSSTQSVTTAVSGTSSGPGAGSSGGTTPAPTTSVVRPPRATLAGIYCSEGLLALYKGLSMRLATVIPASAIMITIYETIKRLDIDV